MAIPEIKRSPARPEEIFPGVPAWRMDIAKVNPRVADLTPDEEHFLVHLAQTANHIFDELACAMAPGEKNVYFTIKTTKEAAKNLVDKTARAICDVTRDQQNVHLVFFPAGAIPIAKRIQDMGYPAGRMHALDISGSQGTESGNASINDSIPRQLLDPDNAIVIPEDIIDTVNTIMTFIQARGESRNSSMTHKTWLRTLQKRLKAAHDNDNNDPEAYAEFARVAAEENVSVLSVWSKNEQAQKALVKQACCITPDASFIQKNLFFHYPIIPLPRKMWVLGGDYVMDTGILCRRIQNKLLSHYADWLVRAVRIGPLAFFETEDQERNVVTFMEKLATLMITR